MAYHFSANHRLHSHLRIQRLLVENATENSVLSLYDLGDVIIVVRLSDYISVLLDNKEDR